MATQSTPLVITPNDLGPGVDSSSMAAEKTVVIKGLTQGKIIIEGSNDGGLKWCHVAEKSAGPGSDSLSFTAVSQQLRVDARQGSASSVVCSSEEASCQFMSLDAPADGPGASKEVTSLGSIMTAMADVWGGSVKLQISQDNATWGPATSFKTFSKSDCDTGALPAKWARAVGTGYSGTGIHLGALDGLFEVIRNSPTGIGDLGEGTLAELNAAVTDATLDDSGDSRPCDNTFDTPATARTNLDVYSTSEVDGKVVGLYEHKGSYDAATNSPDLDTAPIATFAGDAYTVSVAGNFFTEAVEAGDVLIADQDSPTMLTHWTRVNKNISFGTTTGTACEGDDSRLSDARTPTAHALGGAEHSADTLANLNTKVSDATLIDTGDSRLSDKRTASAMGTTGADVDVDSAAPPSIGQVLKATSATTATWQAAGAPAAHDLGGAEHAADTLANLNTKVSDATLGGINDAGVAAGEVWSANKLNAEFTAVISGYSRRLAVIDIAISTAVPPTEVSGDRYIIDFSGAPNAAWDGATQGDIVEFDGASWVATAPLEGYVSYLDAQNKDALYVDDGAPTWEIRDIAVTDHVDLSNIGVNTHAQIDTHIADAANPHATDVANLGSGTLAELNTAITDATLDDSSAARTPSSHAFAGAEHSVSTLATVNGKISDATLIDTGDARLGDSRTCDNTFDDAATSRTALDVYSTSEVDGKVVGLYEHKGAYNAATNTPDLDTAPAGVLTGDAYTVSVAGNFFAEAMEVGDVIIADQDNPTLLTHWTRVNKNISFGAVGGSACEGNDSRLSDSRTPTAHGLGAAEHSADTLANLNTKVTDATLIDTGDSRLSDARTPSSHAFAGAEHSASTLASVNTKVSDATLIDTTDARLSNARTPTSHAFAGAEHSVSTLAAVNSKVSDATLIDTTDARLSDSRVPNGAAGGDLAGTYPNPTIAALAVDTAELAAGAVTAAKAAIFASAEVTATGANQDTAHGLGVVPSLVLAIPTAGNDGAGAAGVQFTVVTEGVHDATNVKITGTNGGKYKIMAWA